MSSQDTRTLITQALDRFTDEVPALKNLKLVLRLELRAHGGDVPIWRVELPGPKITKDPAGDARVDVSVARPEFNQLATKGRVKDWATAYERGHVRVSGDAGVIRLVGQVVQRQLARGQQLA
ncbi:MAG TPA: hypothetical protein VH300_05315 [Thermoleophilaceae bacterium]|jgi:hypothetical protein|nr:hypothetical protein [Thermoleophilaceae bacterium]